MGGRRAGALGLASLLWSMRFASCNVLIERVARIGCSLFAHPPTAACIVSANLP